MARIDKLISAMRQHNAQRCLLGSDQPVRLIVNGRQISGTVTTAAQLDTLLTEITPSGNVPAQSGNAALLIDYTSHEGTYVVSITRTSSLVQATISEKVPDALDASAPVAGLPNSQLNAVAADNGADTAAVELEQPLAPTLLASLRSDSDVRSIAFSRDDQLLACGCLDGRVRIWDLSAGAVCKTISHSSIPIVGAVTSLAFSPNKNGLVSGSNGKIAFWDLSTEKVIWSKKGLNKFYSVDCSPDGNCVASADSYAYVNFWKEQDGKLIQSTDKSFIKGMAVLDKGPQIAFVAFDGTGKSLACGQSREAKIYNVESGKLTSTLGDTVGGALAIMMAMAYSNNGKSLAAGFASTGETKVVLWNTETGSQRPLKSHGAAVTALAFSPIGKVLATGGRDGTVKMWDVESGELLRTIQAQSNAINAVTFSKNGQMLASGSDDRSVQLYRLA